MLCKRSRPTPHSTRSPAHPSALKLDPPTYNGRTDFREWKRKLELIYDAKQLSAAPNTYAEVMQVLTRRHTDGNDEFHYRAALVSIRQTGDLDAYVDRFLDLSSDFPPSPSPKPASR